MALSSPTSGHDNFIFLPTMSPTFSEATDWHQITAINDQQMLERRLNKLEGAVERLQQYDLKSQSQLFLNVSGRRTFSTGRSEA
jgi:TolA-binding protein